MRFRKKPVEVEAVLWTGSNTEDVVPFMGAAVLRGRNIEIETLEGTMTANPGDWIIRGIKGEFYPCKPDIFEGTYERVTA